MTPALAIAGLEDTSLMLLVKEQDHHPAFEALVSRHRRPVVNYIYRMVQSQATAEELAQDVFLRVYQVRGGYVPSAKFTTWLYTLATNRTLKWLRDNKRRNADLSLDATFANGQYWQFADDAPGIDRRLMRKAEEQHIRAALNRLPERQRAVVIMHKYENRSYDEIAQALSTTVPAIKSLAFRAYFQLRTALSAGRQ